jgi:hypothetical protein
MERSRKKVAVLNRGVRLTDEIAPSDLEGVAGGRPPTEEHRPEHMTRETADSAASPAPRPTSR